MHFRPLLPLSISWLLLAAATGNAQDAAPTPVVAALMQPQPITLTATLPGRVRPLASSEVRPQVGGIINERLFAEGSDVRSGDILYRIDATTYEAALAQAQASLRQAQVQHEAAEREYARIEKLSGRGVSSRQALDQALAARDAAQAQVGVAEAQTRSARIELDRTEIRARLSGRIGFSAMTEGALVTASQSTPLAVIRQIDRVYVDVTQSAAELVDWRDGDGGKKPAAQVRLMLANGSEYGHAGLLTAAEPYVDEQTGVVLLRIEFPNPDMILLPGMYVQVEMPMRQAENVFLLPQNVVTRDRRGNPQAWFVTDENKVEQRPITILEDQGNNWVVSGGVNAGDRVVLTNLQRLAPGREVAVEVASNEQKS